jgi:hypothetical protein
MWESVPEGGSAEGWVELDENGWGALIGWAVVRRTSGAVPRSMTAPGR